jgi:hypothetical protein
VFHRTAGKLFRDLQQAQADGSLGSHLAQMNSDEHPLLR